MMNDCFNVNVVAPLMLTKALHKEMRYPEGSSGGQYELKKPLIVNIGAILGSIGLNDKGGAQWMDKLQSFRDDNFPFRRALLLQPSLLVLVQE